MAGARVEIDIDDKAVLEVFGELLARVSDPAPALAEIGEYGVESTRERIESQNASDPLYPWEPLSERYLKSKRKRNSAHPDLSLMLHGYLVSTFAWQADASSVEWGTNRKYAAAQNFGRDEIHLPPRPFLGLSGQDSATVLEILHDWLDPTS